MTGDTGQNGLHDKFEVYKNGERQTGCFVLKPSSDEAARAALLTYATETENDQLAADIRELVARLNAMDDTKEKYADSEMRRDSDSDVES